MIYITQSQIKSYKACKRKYELSYIENLRPVTKAESLEIGSNYHSKIESIIKHGYFEYTGDKTDAMAYAFEKYILPQMPKLKESEKEFSVQLDKDVTLIGKIDAIAENGYFVEHKTTSSKIEEDYIFGLNWDEQIPAYMIAGNINTIYYTVCMKPTIRQTQKETLEDYIERCIKWYDEDTEHKIRMFIVTRQPQELEEKKQEIIKIAKEIENCKFFYCNPSNCTAYGRRCEYASICLNYDPKVIPIEFTKKDKKNEELEVF